MGAMDNLCKGIIYSPEWDKVKYPKLNNNKIVLDDVWGKDHINISILGEKAYLSSSFMTIGGNKFYKARYGSMEELL